MTASDTPISTDHTHAPSNGKVELTLEQLALMQPSVARLMLEVSNRFSRGYHAAKAKNSRLARFQLSEGSKVLRLCAVVQPRYVAAIDQFMAEHVNVVRDLIEAKDWGRLDSSWEAMTAEINRWHEEFAHGFLIWKVSDAPPEDLDLTPLD
jgi:hypothetical protein